MRNWFTFCAVVGLLPPTAGTELMTPVVDAPPADAMTAIQLRFVARRVASCIETAEAARRRPIRCGAKYLSMRNFATLLFSPLPDPNRQLLRVDRRSPFSVELIPQNGPVEQRVMMGRGPWRVTWKESGKHAQFSVGDSTVSVVVTETLGECVNLAWRCRLEPQHKYQRLEVRSSEAK